MNDNQDKNLQTDRDRNLSNDQDDSENAGIQAVKQANSLGGGENRGGGEEVGQFGDDEFMQTDQTITQAAPGQTATSTNQGSSNV